MIKKFDLGHVIATPGAGDEIERCDGVSVSSLLRRHIMGDWGDVDPSGVAANDAALVSGDRLLSSYKLHTGVTVLCLTEGDRSVTTFLLPDEY